MTSRKFPLHRAFLFLLAGAIAFTLAGCSGSGTGSNNSGGSGGSGGGGGNTPTLAPFAAGAAADVYVIQNSATGAAGGQVLEFAAGAGANAATVATLMTDLYINSIATDQYGSIYVAGSPSNGSDKIEVFAAGATGSATPTRTITITGGYPPTTMAVDTSLSLYTADGNGTINVYSSTATGSATPSRTIYGASTGIAYPLGITVDTSNNIYVSVPMIGNSPAAILVFSSTASGNVAPTRTITTSNTSDNFYGLATDSTGNLYAALDTIGTTYSSVLVEYGPTATGKATPLKTIGGANTQFVLATGMRSDAAGNLYVVNLTGTSMSANRTYSIEQFSSAATGNVAPTAVTTSTAFATGAGTQLALR